MLLFVLCFILQSCSSLTDKVNDLKNNYSNDKWSELMGLHSKQFTQFEESGKQHITVEIDDKFASSFLFGAFTSEMRTCLEIVSTNPNLTGDVIITTKQEMLSPQGTRFGRNALLITFPISKIKEVDFREISGTRLIYANASKIVLISPAVKSEVAKRCIEKGLISSVPNLCQAAL